MEKTNEITDSGQRWLDTLEQDDQGRYVIKSHDEYLFSNCFAEFSGVKADEIGDAVLVYAITDDMNGVVAIEDGTVFASAHGAAHLYVGSGSEPLTVIVCRSAWTLRNADTVRCAVERAMRKDA